MPEVALPTKAKFGTPCTHCGRCCANEICDLMLAVAPDSQPPCPELGYSKDSNQFACRLVQVEQFTMPHAEWAITQALGIGRGCDSEDILEDNNHD